MTDHSLPQFAVVGHPNKGKSSIVSTLSHNDDVVISSQSGTTQTADPITVETLHGRYQLIDTPGFQRPIKVLKWLNEQQVNAHERAAAVAKFVDDPVCQQQFPDEVALLKPIINGAAILYVVDGSRPYGAEYDAEMEILRWTGQPSMALINPIENTDHITEWQNALAQYFKSVRVFNPMKADFDKQVELLKTFAHLNPDWANTLTAITDDLVHKRDEQRDTSIKILARLVDDLCHYQQSQKVLNKAQAKQVQPVLEKRYQHWMKQREQTAIKELLANYAHFQVDIDLDHLDLPPDLFDCSEWFAWGLNKQQLMYAATMTGAVGGAAVDFALAGHSFMLGAIGGGLVGFGSAWFGADKLVNISLKGLPLGGYQACIGPIKNRNFPYVILGRFIFLYQQISQLNHANRTALQFNATDFQDRVATLEKSSQKELHTACERLVKQKPVDDLESVIAFLFD
jgi:hypothetical protein